MLEPIFMKLGMYIMTTQPISEAYFIYPSHQSVCLYEYTPLVASQRLVKINRAATNAQENIKELLDELFSTMFALYQGKQAISSSLNFLFSVTFIKLHFGTRNSGHKLDAFACSVVEGYTKP
jgi:hypothetical protein